MRRLLKNGGQLLSCNLEKKGTRVAGLTYAVQLRWRNYHRTKCANARRKIIEKNRIRRGKRVSIFVLDALSPLLSSLSPLSSVRATFGIALSKFTGNPCDVCLALRATRENGTFVSRLLMRLVIISFFLPTTF